MLVFTILLAVALVALVFVLALAAAAAKKVVEPNDKVSDGGTVTPGFK